jgi:hypothetical protein
LIVPTTLSDRARASRIVRWGYPLLAFGLVVLYLPTLAPGATFTDGPELVAAVVALGVAHPTGYPLFILVGHAFTKLLALPILACVKVEFMNALCAAGAALFTAHTVRELVALGRTSSPDADVAGLFAGLMLGIAPLVWEQVRIPEVYAMHLFLVAWAGYAWVRFEATGNTAYVLGAALPMGMGLAHHVTMVYMLPPAFVYLLVRRPTFFVAWAAYPVVWVVRRFRPGFAASRTWAGWWGFPVACVVGFLPLLSYGYLVWANKHSAGVPWGDVSGWDGLYAHFTGRQYHGFMRSLDRAGHVTRLLGIAPLFDLQFLPEGTVMFLVGLVVAFRRAWRPALFFLLFLLFNVAHGAHYGVGDFGTYYIPACYVCAVFIGVGLEGLLGLARARSEAWRPALAFGAIGVMLAGAAASVIGYAYLTNRLPAPLAKHPWPLAVLFLCLSVASNLAAVRARRTPSFPRPLPAGALPAVLVTGLAISLVPISLSRAHDFASQSTVGESYGAEVAAGLPRGSVLMTQGDGYLFTMWYENHVHAAGLDAAVIDVGNIHTPWFQRYVFSHHPVACDPMSPENLRDLVGFSRRCDSFDKRLALGPASSWVSFGVVGNRRPFFGVRKGPILRANDQQCADKTWHDAHVGKECRCWGFGASSGATEAMLEEDCAESAEENGIVPREHVEIFAQRIIEDMLDERPVFERNVLTQWAGASGNPRGWDGPTYQRISGEYALVARGRFHQVVWWDDLRGHDACGDVFQPLRMRPFVPPRTRPAGADRRRRYVPNPRPMLLLASYLVTRPEGVDDDATRAIRRGDPVWIRMDWFERFYWDASKEGRHGKPIHHGVRACAFGPDGHKIASVETVSGSSGPYALLGPGVAREPGTYHVAACSLGEVDEEKAPFGDARKCAWTVLDYEFVVAP